MKTRAAIATIVIAVVITTVAACSGTEKAGIAGGLGAPTAAGTSAAGGAGGALAPGAAGVQAGANAIANAPAAGPALPADDALPAAKAPAAAGGAPASAPAVSPLLASRALIRTTTLTVKVSAVSVADQVETLAANAGAAVDGDDRTIGKDASATLVLEVPPHALGSLMTAIAKLGSEQARTLGTQDVTTQVADVNSRVRSARDAITRLQALFAQASGIGDVITIENQLDQREANLEALEAQQRALASETAMAKLTVRLTTTTPAPKPAPAKHNHGIGGGVRRGWHNFTTFITSTLTGLGLVGPFAILFAVLGAAALVVLGRLRRSGRLTKLGRGGQQEVVLDA